MTREIVAWLLALHLVVVISVPALAQKNARNKQDERRENQRVADAQKSVREHQAELQQAEQKLKSLLRTSATLELHLNKARSQWREKREQVADEMAKSMGIDAALSRLKQAKAELAEYSQPIHDALHQKQEWIAAKKSADQAKSEIETLREEIGLGEDERNSKLNALTDLVLKPGELDRQAILDSEKGKSLSEKVDDAQAAVGKIRRAIPDEKVDANPAVVQAKKAIDQAEQELKKHAQSQSVARGGVQKAQVQLNQSRLKLQQAQAADARDKNRK